MNSLSEIDLIYIANSVYRDDFSTEVQDPNAHNSFRISKRHGWKAPELLEV